jgi:hypothetical protein
MRALAAIQQLAIQQVTLEDRDAVLVAIEGFDKGLEY